MRLATPDQVRRLQNALHAKAKGSPNFRFYSLYDKLYRPDVLRFAYRCVRANEGAPGVDGQMFETIEAYGLDRWLDELAEPTVSWIGTRGIGSVSGCEGSISWEDGELHGSPINICIRPWA